MSMDYYKEINPYLEGENDASWRLARESTSKSRLADFSFLERKGGKEGSWRAISFTTWLGHGIHIHPLSCAHKFWIPDRCIDISNFYFFGFEAWYWSLKRRAERIELEAATVLFSWSSCCIYYFIHTIFWVAVTADWNHMYVMMKGKIVDCCAGGCTMTGKININGEGWGRISR